MKKILITGARSYIGTSFEKWMQQYGDKYQIDTLDMRNLNWKEYDFSVYDSVFHVAGIAHIKETRKNRDLYEKVNYKLVVDLANIVKQQGVKQFIFLSSMSVYGIEEGVIDENTIEKPKSAYGISKYLAEKELTKLENSKFRVSIIRPPMVYGKNCKGNYPNLVSLAKINYIFPNFTNQRSMIYINNLSAYIKIIIDKNFSGIFFPQNKEFVSTSSLIYEVRKNYNKKTLFIGFLNPLIKFMIKRNILVKKVYGNLFYKKNIDRIDFKIYNIVNFSNSIKETEDKND